MLFRSQASGTPGAGTVIGIGGNAASKGLATNVWGLNFTASYVSCGGVEAVSIRVKTAWISSSGFTLTRIVGLQVETATRSGVGTGTDIIGVWVKTTTIQGFTNGYGIKIDDITLATNKYLIWCDGQTGGAGLPNLRLDAQNPPNAGLAAEGDSQLFLAWMENGVVFSRRCRTKTFATLAAGDKVMIAV